MKLLFCHSCNDLFKLTFTERSCECGKVTGLYVNTEEAVTNGEGSSIAIGNGSLLVAVSRTWGESLPDRKAYQDECSIMCWARPNEGPGNPHTRVEAS